MTRKLALLLLSASLVVLAAACGGDGEVTVKGPGGEVNIGDEGITVEGPSGEVNIGTGEYPEGWPSDFPLPDGASPVYSLAAGGGVSVWFGTDQSVDEVKSYYTDALPAAGYTIESQADFSDESGSYSVFTIGGNGWTGGLYLGEGAGAAAPGFEGDFDFFVSLTPAT